MFCNKLMSCLQNKNPTILTKFWHVDIIFLNDLCNKPELQINDLPSSMNELISKMRDMTTISCLNDFLANFDEADRLAIKRGLSSALGEQELMAVHYFIDARHLSCPMPLLRAKVALKTMSESTSLCLLATDRHSQTDLMAYCQKNMLDIKMWQHEAVFYFIITK